MKTLVQEFSLSQANIAIVSSKINTILNAEKLEPKLISSTLSKVEEVLLLWLGKLPNDSTCKLRVYKRFGRLTIRLRHWGNSVNPLSMPHEDMDSEGFFFYKLLDNTDIVSRYHYRDGVNEVEIRTPLKLPKDMTSRILMAILLSIATGFALNMLLPKSTLLMLSKDVLGPAVKTLLGLLNGTAGIMIFFSMVAAVCNMGDISTLSTVGSTTLKQFMSRVFLCSLIALPLGLCGFGVLQEGSSMQLSIFSEVYKLILGMVPTNMVEPFVKGNTMQMMVVALLFGYVTLQLGKRVGTVHSFINEISIISMDTVRFVCKLLPLIVFLSLLNLQVKGDFSSLLNVWKLLVFYYLLTIICLVCHFLYVSHKTDIPLGSLSKNILPIFMLGGATMTSTPCLPLMDKLCQEKYGVSDTIRSFAIPFSSILYMCYHVIGIIGYVCCMAQIYNISISLSTAIIIFICCNIMAYTIPPIPMGLMTILALFFNLANIPGEGLAIAMSVDFIFAGIRMGAKVASSTADIILIDRLLCAKQSTNFSA